MLRLVFFFLSLISISTYAQSRSEQVAANKFRTKVLNDSTKSRLIAHALIIKNKISSSELNKTKLARAFALSSSGKIASLDIDTSKPIRDIRKDIDKAWNGKNYQRTYFVYFVRPFDISKREAGSDPSKKSLGVEIEDASLTGTVAVLFPLERRKSKWVYKNAKPEVIYMERL